MEPNQSLPRSAGFKGVWDGLMKKISINVNRDIVWYRDLLRVLVQKELTVRYKRSLLGFFWSVLNPLANAMVFYVVFKLFMRMNVPHFIVVLLSAMFPWQCFVNCVTQGVHTFIANPTLIKKVAFPREAIPLVMNLQNFAHLIFSFPIYLLFMFYEGLYPGLIWIWGVPLMLLLTLMTTYGLSLFLGTLNVFFRDLGNLVTIFIQLAFFGTPIMYVISIVPEKYIWIFKVNPVAPLFISWRSLLAENVFYMEWLLEAGFYACLFLFAGISVYNRLNHKFAEVI